MNSKTWVDEKKSLEIISYLKSDKEEENNKERDKNCPKIHFYVDHIILQNIIKSFKYKKVVNHTFVFDHLRYLTFYGQKYLKSMKMNNKKHKCPKIVIFKKKKKKFSFAYLYVRYRCNYRQL